jgi:hypothetical protein
MASRGQTQTPKELFDAIITNNYSAVQSYIENGGNPNVDLASFVPAARRGNEVAQITLLRAQDLLPGHLTPLHLAVFNCCKKSDHGWNIQTAISIVRLLIGAGADTSATVVNIRLHCVHFSNRLENVKNVNIPATPCDLAVLMKQYDHSGLVQGLVDEMIELRNETSVVVHKSVLKTLKALLFSEKFSDVKFICQDGTTFHAHKNMLAAASPYFSTAFEGPWGEQHQDGLWETSNSPTVMKAVLSFIYIGAITPDLMDQQPADMLAVASEYSLPCLRELCEAHYARSVSVDNLKIMLQLAHLHGSSPLKRSCFDFAKKNIIVLGHPLVLSLAAEDAGLWAELVTAAVSPDND